MLRLVASAKVRALRFRNPFSSTTQPAATLATHAAPPTVAQIVCAPQRPPLVHATKLFLAGTTPVQGSKVDWRQVVRDAVLDLPVTVLDPLRPDWDSSWKEDPSFLPFRQQVEWELEMQEQATLIAFYFDPAKEGMVSLLELGLCAGRAAVKAVVVCPPGYVKHGNVLVTCARYHIPVVETAEALAEVVKKAVGDT